MKLASFIDRLDDWINPIVVKELRQAVRSRVVIFLIFAFLLGQVCIVGSALLFRQASSFDGETEWAGGRDIFAWLQGVLAFTLILLVPAYACIRLAAERSDQNVDLLFISTLKPHAIVAGKFFAAFLLGVLIFACCAPFMTFTYLLRGLDIPAILFLLSIDLLALLFSTMIGILLASIPGGLVSKILAIAVGYVAILMPVCYNTIGGTVMLLVYEEAGPADWASPDFWGVTGSMMSAVLASVGLMFAYAVGLISPASSNRVLPVRLYVLGVWVLSVGGMLYAGQYLSGRPWLAAIIIWTLSLTIVLGLQFVISISERDQAGPRLRRQIPKNLLLRLPAFFVYTGAANGITFTLFLYLATLALGAFWLERASSAVAVMGGHAGPDTSVPYIVGATVLLYLYDYGMLAVLVRVYLLGGHLRAGFTWLILALLVGIGSSLPGVLAFIAFQGEMHAGSDSVWWKLPSPFLAAFNVTNDFRSINNDYLTVTLWFLFTWAVLMTLLALPWYVRQLIDFKPRERPAMEVATLAEEPAAGLPAVAADAPAEGVTAERPAARVQSG